MSDTLTPMMQQYRRAKAELPDGVILFFRLGDFYEMFFDDARRAAPLLDVALTQRNGVPMCGVPYHAVDGYLAKLIRAGLKIAICDQVEDAAGARGLVRREVTRVVTAGTVTEETILESGRNNFLAGVHRAGDACGVAFLDLSTGLFRGERIAGAAALRETLLRESPGECILSEDRADDPELAAIASARAAAQITLCEDWIFGSETARDRLLRHFGVKSLAGFGCDDEGDAAIVGAAGAVLHYVGEVLRRRLDHVRSFGVRNAADHLFLDETTCRNLDLIPPQGTRQPSLLGVLDATRTAMGARALRDWMLRPLTDLARIGARHDAVGALVADRGRLKLLREALGGVRDLERLVARLGAGTGNARDLVAVAQSLDCVPGIRAEASGTAPALMQDLCGALVEMPDLVALVRRALVDDPPASARDGGVVRAGYSADLDALRDTAATSRRWLAEYQTREQERTGIRTLKVRHNKVFGYYIEVSRGQSDNVPDDYVRRQTLVGAERFVTPELKEFENRIFGAQERALALEHSILAEVRDAVVAETRAIQRTAVAIGDLDGLAALADRAAALGYARPEMSAGDRLQIRAGRHPVIERMPAAERFVPNDTLLDCALNQVAIITGPNMAGKSTYIRQVALIVIMAQMGSFVPAEAAQIGIVDRVFTRVGASDDLARGRSTFMVEMQETANILNNATPRSLVVLDEIGRGTSTFDGISIAWAVAEFLHNNARVKARTLFATHYHELTDLARALAGVRNYNVLVRERGDSVVFLRRIVPGAADKSYGIHVARLAGLPPEVVDRAREVLANLEEGEFGEAGAPALAKRRVRRVRDDAAQLGLPLAMRD